MVDLTLRLIGKVRLRQLRVRNNSCSERRFTQFTSLINGVMEPSFDTKDHTCFAEFAEGSTDERESFVGPVSGLTYSWTGGLSLLR